MGFRKAPEKPKHDIGTEAILRYASLAASSKKSNDTLPEKKKKSYNEIAVQLIKQAINMKKEKKRDNNGDTNDERSNYEIDLEEAQNIKEKLRIERERDKKEAQAKDAVNDTFVDLLLDSMWGPCGKNKPNTNADLNQETDEFTTDKKDGIIYAWSI